MVEQQRQPERDLHSESLPALIGDLTEEFSVLVSKEVSMAKAELNEKIRQSGLAAGMFAGAMLAAMMAFGTLTALAIIALAIILPPWLAALIVTAFWLLAVAIFALIGRREVKQAIPPIPDKTVETVKEDVAWLRHPSKSGKR